LEKIYETPFFFHIEEGVQNIKWWKPWFSECTHFRSPQHYGLWSPTFLGYTTWENCYIL